MTIGIDLGTTNSCAAAVIDGKATVIPNDENGRTTPSVISFLPDHDPEAGEYAKHRRVSNATRTVWSVKRFMGRSWSACQAKHEFDRLPYRTTRGADDSILILAGGRAVSVPEASSLVLDKLRRDCSARLGQQVTQAVITVPAYFTDVQREATRKAGELAGLDVRRIISEPTAAALAYGAQTGKDGVCAVYDLGGGTFDISILRIHDGEASVISTAGDTMLGGDDIDRRVSDWIIREGKAKTGYNLQAAFDAGENGSAYTMQAVRDAAEKAKIALSSAESAPIEVQNYSPDGATLSTTLSRAMLEHITSYVTDKTIECCRKALHDAGNAKPDHVVLVGGSTKSPFVRRQVEDFFGVRPDTSVNPDEAVALGAAILAASLDGKDTGIRLRDVAPLDLGILSRQKTKETHGFKTAIATIIHANTPIPASWKRTFTTSCDNQQALTLTIMQGTSRLGRVSVPVNPHARAGQPRVQVTFSIDADGILSVSAADLGTGRTVNAVMQKNVN